MPKYIHAELMKQSAEDAMTTGEPWKLMKVFNKQEKYEVKFDNNLNEAGWCFNETCNEHGIEVSPAIFNNCKNILKGVIEGYLERMSKEEVERLMKTK